MTTVEAGERKRPVRWHIGDLPCARRDCLFADHDPAALRHAAAVAVHQRRAAPGLRRPRQFPHAVRRPALGCQLLECARATICWFFVIHMLVQNPHRRAACRPVVQPAAALPGILPHGDLHPDHPLLCHRRLRVEAHPFAALGCSAAPPRHGLAEGPVRAVARQGRIRADGTRADLGLAVRRHPDDADLCRASFHSRGGDRGRRMRRHHRRGAVLEDQAAAHPAGHRHHLDPDLRRQLQCLRPDLFGARSGGGSQLHRPIFSAPSSTAPSSASSCRSAIPIWAQPSPR